MAVKGYPFRAGSQCLPVPTLLGTAVLNQTSSGATYHVERELTAGITRGSSLHADGGAIRSIIPPDAPHFCPRPEFPHNSSGPFDIFAK